MLTVCEIFRSIQGESTFAGWPCVFVRLTGCNLNCAYCDTTYAREGDGERYEVADVVSKVTAFTTHLVEITGGEPLLQPESLALSEYLVDLGHRVLVETNGSVELPPDRQFTAVMDWKCPSSGMTGAMRFDNLTRLRDSDELKFVIGGRDDFEYACGILREHNIDPVRITILFSPLHPTCSAATLADWVLTSGLHVRLQLQLHKILWPECDRGR